MYSQQKFGRTYLWRPANPGNVTQIDVPSGYPNDGSQDFFCGGHTFLQDGSLLWVGGTDVFEQCWLACDCQPTSFVGHEYAWRLDTKPEIPTWHLSGATSYASRMGMKRWYPSAVLDDAGRALVHGHAALPNNDSEEYRETYEYDPDTQLGVWQSTLENLRWTSNCVAPSELVPVPDYPRLHLLPNGYLFWPQAYRLTSMHALEVIPSQFLDLRVPGCSEPRWRGGPEDDSEAYALHQNGGSVLLVTWDPTADPGEEFKTVVYMVGGAQCHVEAYPGDPDYCDHIADAGVHGVTEKMVNPHPDSGAWVTVDALTQPRVNHNTVLLLDGSLLTVGGVDSTWIAQYPNGPSYGSCEYRLSAERFVPPELFDGTPSTAYWELMAEQAVPRQYHSVALLLPDGTVMSAGGRNLTGCQPYGSGFPTGACAPIASEDPDLCKPDHSLEIYTPPYFFNGQRPEIDPATLEDPAVEFYPYGDPITFEVTLRGLLDRVAILRNGAATHAFDSDQHYVELEVVEVLEVEGQANRWSVTALAPLDGYTAPPGYYMLTAIDNLNRPSIAQWIRIDRDEP